MGVTTKCTCDICNAEMPVPDNALDNDRPAAVRISECYTSHLRIFQFVCDSCLKLIHSTVTNILKNSIEFNQDLINKVTKKYFGPYGNEKRLIDAIKELRSLTGFGLKESKDLCELWREKYWGGR